MPNAGRGVRTSSIRRATSFCGTDLNVFAPPEHLSGCSQYTCHHKQLTIGVWGFGIYAGQANGMFLNRYEFVPRRAILTDAWQPARIGQGARMYDVGLLLRFGLA